MLHIHRAERADRLVEALGDVLRQPLADSVQAEVVAVPTRGVERWLTQRLSATLGTSGDSNDGVCANVDFPFPGRVVHDAMADVAGIDRDSDPWLPERAVWPLLEVVEGCLGEPWLAPLAVHLGGPEPAPDAERRARRFSTVRHVADLYDRYAVHRPDMVRRWAAGVDAAPADPATGTQWQARLWRCLRERIAIPSPAERLPSSCDRIRDDPARVRLPARASLFGLTRLPASYLQVLEALGAGRHVHLFLLHPSPVLWSRVAEALDPLRCRGRGRPEVTRQDDPTAGLPRNPLLGSWGRDSREMQVVLAGVAGGVVEDPRPVPVPESALLQRIQADIRADREPPGAPLGEAHDRRPLLEADDRSVQVHACHGRDRQVEVLRDAILHLLSDDAGLEARDVIVMCPDIETFAPLIQATFGADDDSEAGLEPDPAEAPPRHDLRVRLADRSLRQTNPLLGVVSQLLDLASARVTAAQVLDLAGRDPVRRRFRFDDDDLARLEEWVAATGVRWGIDAPSRAPYKLDQLRANTWDAGLDRVLLGVTMAEDDQRLVGGVLPLDDVDSNSIDLAGRLAELIARLRASLLELNRSQPVWAWRKALAEAADALATTRQSEAWQRSQFERLLDDVVTEASAGGASDNLALALPEIRALLADRLRGRPTRANFRTGHLTVCTLVPMRSVPHRVVCLLGLDDGVFPRQTARDGDDVMLCQPHVGDPDVRGEDRQLLLDAVMAATEQLVVVYSGRDERTNVERPPAVPVGELLDVIDRTVRTCDDRPARHHVVVHHPLQPFDARNFIAGRLLAPKVWSFDRVALDGARQLLGNQRPAQGRFLARPLPAEPCRFVEVEQLVRFVQHPVKAFLRQRLGLSLADHSHAVVDALPVELDPLEKWQVGERLVQARLAGAGPGACMAVEIARGALPPGALAAPTLDEVEPIVDDVVAQALAVADGAGAAASVDVNLRLSDGRLLVGTVGGLVGHVVRIVTYSRIAPKHRLAAWVRFLAVTAAYPGAGYEVATVGRARRGARGRPRVTVARLAFRGCDPAARAELARRQLIDLISLYDRGMCEPLPLYCNSSAAYAAAAAAGRDTEEAGRRAWESEWSVDHEDKELEHQLVLGGIRPFSDVLAGPPGHDERGDGWDASHPSRFGRYAVRLWAGVCACEELVDR